MVIALLVAGVIFLVVFLCVNRRRKSKLLNSLQVLCAHHRCRELFYSSLEQSMCIWHDTLQYVLSFTQTHVYNYTYVQHVRIHINTYISTRALYKQTQAQLYLCMNADMHTHREITGKQCSFVIGDSNESAQTVKSFESYYPWTTNGKFLQ